MADADTTRPGRASDPFVAVRVIGLLLAAAVLATAGFAAWRMSMLFQNQAQDVSVETARFVERVRACRKAAPKPMPSWAACEDRVRAAEWSQPRRRHVLD